VRAAAIVVLVLGAHVAAQQAAPTPRALAPIDLTGYWVSIVNEDWRWRMQTPPKGDVSSVPVNAEGRRAAEAWDYEREQTPANACKPFGVGGLSRMPGRIHITWQDDQTLKLEFDAGTQTRVLRFGAPAAPPNTQASLQGYSAARWEPGLVPTAGIPLGFGPRVGTRSRSLEVTTTNLSPGYLRKNGVPYGARTTVTEYFEAFSEPGGDTHLMVMTVVNDPEYLAIPFVTTSDFKKEADGSKWDPSPCSAR